MPSKLTPYPIPDSYPSALLKNAPDAVPSVDELERIHSELKSLRQRAIERAKKAGEDLRIIDESMRRMKEKEKGKLKAVDKIKRERECTSILSSGFAEISWTLFISLERLSWFLRVCLCRIISQLNVTVVIFARLCITHWNNPSCTRRVCLSFPPPM